MLMRVSKCSAPFFFFPLLPHIYPLLPPSLPLFISPSLSSFQLKKSQAGRVSILIVAEPLEARLTRGYAATPRSVIVALL